MKIQLARVYGTRLVTPESRPKDDNDGEYQWVFGDPLT